MSEAKSNPNTARVEGELNQDDLNQIAGGTSGETLPDFDAGGGFSTTVESDGMFVAVGAKGTDQLAQHELKPMNMTTCFP